jgi:Ca2+-transporting ATPase
VIVLLVMIVEMDVLHGFFTPTDLTSVQWLARAPAVGSAGLWVGELLKIVLRARAPRIAAR